MKLTEIAQKYSHLSAFHSVINIRIYAVKCITSFCILCHMHIWRALKCRFPNPFVHTSNITTKNRTILYHCLTFFLGRPLLISIFVHPVYCLCVGSQRAICLYYCLILISLLNWVTIKMTIILYTHMQEKKQLLQTRRIKVWILSCSTCYAQLPHRPDKLRVCNSKKPMQTCDITCDAIVTWTRPCHHGNGWRWRII